MNQLKPVREGQVDGRPIFVFDDLVDKKINDEIHTALTKAPFTRSEVARPETAAYRHWAYNMPLEKAQHLPIAQKAQEAIDSLFETRYRMYRCYCNVASFGDMLFTHTDCQPNAQEMTALWFIQKEWNHEWGGETLFYDNNNDAAFVASPKPGRLVIFDGAILHAGRPPNRICTEPRYTFAMKFEKF
jgi:Rps23 Pro-64 3,4-dihydroxylase Tpa1-like proline 4-hydroxylase